MTRMDDKEFFGAAAGKSWFAAGCWGAPSLSTEINRSIAATADSFATGEYAQVRSVSMASPLDRVADPELRQVMESVLQEDADLIASLRHR